MSKICLCLSGKTLAQDLAILDENRKYIDIAELRVDCLDPDERFLIRRFPEMAGLPVILSIRRIIDGGGFVGGEGSRIKLLANGLAYADANRRRNFAYVDLEDDLEVPSLEEAARTYGTRIIRSLHNQEGVDDDLAIKLRKLRRVGDELVKVTLKPQSLDEVIKVYRAGKETLDIEKVIDCTGEYSVSTKILAELLGSSINYVYSEWNLGGESVLDDPCKLSPREMVENYRFHNINRDTKIFAASGYPQEISALAHFFNAIFAIEQINAVYVPVPAYSVHSLMRLADLIGISGISITAPLNEEILPYLNNISNEVHITGSCNTLVSYSHGWMGYNTDAAGFSESFLDFYGKKDMRGRKVTIIGAGRCARAIAAEVYRLKGKALILNRTSLNARRLAEPYKFAWGGLDSRGADILEKYSDIIIQASSAGMFPDVDIDPIDFYEFSGKETVIDLIYRPLKTLFLKRAEDAGCRTMNGYDMLHRQARSQYMHFMKREFPPSLISRVSFREQL